MVAKEENQGREPAIQEMRSNRVQASLWRT